MKNNSPTKCKRKKRKRIHRKAARGLGSSRNIIKIRCLPHNFIVTKSIKNIIKNVKCTFNNVSKPQSASRNRISINNRITQYIKSNRSVDNFHVFHFTNQFLKQRLIKMANNCSKSNTVIQNITITFDKMLEIRKKRMNFKSGKAKAKNNLANSIIEIDDHQESNNIITIDDGNQLGENSNLVTNPDLKENDDVIIMEDTIQINDNDVIIIGDTVNQENRLVIDNELLKNGNIETNIDSTVENQMLVGENLEEQENLVRPYDVNEENCDNTLKDCTSVEQKQPTLQNVNLSEYIIVEESPCKNSRENSENTSTVNLYKDDIEVKQSNPNDISIPFLSIDDATNHSLIMVSSSSNSTCTNSTISTYANSNNQTRKRKTRSSCSSVITVSDVTDVNYDLDSSDVIFVGEQCEPILPTAKRKKTEPESNSTQTLRRSVRHANKFNKLNEQRRNTSKANNYRNRTLLPNDTSNIPVCMSNNYVDNNICNIGTIRRQGLREIIIDGSNIALGHSNGTIFSVKGLEIAINYFLKRGHKVIAFVPQYRSKCTESSNPQLLRSLNQRQLVIFTPSREVNRRRITPYDDRYIIQYANSCEGIVVSNDNFRDILREKPQWRSTIEKRILMYTWVGDVLMFPEDPLGRYGPNLTQFLKF
ncbi:hypothetical protein ILUMI_25819 [Ignelater luminosus]|uniref:RNase NYN domain-containing protein n=1 Tax=Ignelater luminosus TaxID=2038154 RepID=A0A8K0C7Q8_IGNLU|nr:hypothetical protein ILUMI_25819 [Ignelater luminosus]